MLRLCPIFTFLFLIAGCATSSRFESDRYSAAYYSGSDSFRISGLRTAVGRVVGTASDTAETGNTMNQPPAGEQAVFSLIMSGLSLAINRDYYKSSAISGRCLCANDAASEFQVPCSNIGVILRDLDSDEIRRIQSDDGEFAFGVERDRRYRVSVNSRKFKSARSLDRPLVMGDNIVVHLIPGE
jgi:hypothetical protein